MRKIILFLVFMTAYSFLRSQTIDDCKRELYYEKYTSAFRDFQQVLKQDPDNGEAWFGLMKNYLYLATPAKLTDTLNAAPASVKNNPYFRVATALTLLQQNRKEEAIAIFNAVLDAVKFKDAGIVNAVAWAAINSPNGDPQFAVDVITKGLKKNKHNSELYVQLGDAYRRLSNGSEAFKAYDKAVAEDSKCAVAYYRMGQIFLSQKNTSVYPDYFQKAIAADPAYAPAYYRLYIYEFNRNPAQAMTYYKKYASLADNSIQNEYDLADLLYLNKNYDAAIQKVNSIISQEGDKVKPRLYKLIGYSQAGKKDTADAIEAMKKYFEKEADSNLIAKDYLSMGEYYEAIDGQDSLASIYLAKATTLETDSVKLFDYYKQLADLAKKQRDYAGQAAWLGKYCTLNNNASNLDIFYWGIAHYRTENYQLADSVFGIYINKYPDQSFGYYWQAKSRALQDKDMAAGLAVPAYQKLVDVLQKDSTGENYKKWIVEAYGYLAAYEANTEKDYTEAIGYFEKVLNVDPENENAKKYIEILEKRDTANNSN